MATVTKKCYYSIISKAILFEFYSRARASMSPSTSISKLNKSNTPSPAGSTLSLASNVGGPLKIGDRVIVSSQQGTKTGTLR